MPDFKLKWSGWTAFRAVFDRSLVESIPDVPDDSAHWWGPDTTFFASYLGKNAFTVVGGVYKDPEAEDANVEWDQEASVKLLRDIYTVRRYILLLIWESALTFYIRIGIQSLRIL